MRAVRLGVSRLPAVAKWMMLAPFDAGRISDDTLALMPPHRAVASGAVGRQHSHLDDSLVLVVRACRMVTSREARAR